MGLFEQIQQDIKSIRENTADFGVSIIFTNPASSPIATATIIGKVKKHHLVFDENGMVKANVTNSSCTASILSFDEANFSIRDTDGNIAMQGYTATWTDISGTPITYVIEQWFPNEATGDLVMILGDYGID